MEYQTLNLLFRYSKEFSHEIIKTRDLCDTECMICSFVYSHDHCSQDDIAVALKADKTTVGKSIAALERKKYIKREKDPFDKRINRLSLCDEGREKIADLLNLHNEWLTDIMACLSDEEQEQFRNLCERLLVSAESLSQKYGGKNIDPKN